MTDKPKTIDIGAVRAEFGDNKGDFRSFEVPPWVAKDYSNFKEGVELPEKIDMDLIRGQWQEVIMTSSPMRTVAGGDDTVKSIRLVADKINQLISYIESKEHGE